MVRAAVGVAVHAENLAGAASFSWSRHGVAAPHAFAAHGQRATAILRDRRAVCCFSCVARCTAVVSPACEQAGRQAVALELCW
eukprot:3704394-Pyramimonas_sp.AAC.1